MSFLKNYFLTYNPWKTLIILLVLANFLLTFTSSSVLIFSLFLIFTFLIINGVSNLSKSFSKFIDSKNSVYLNSLFTITSVLTSLKNLFLHTTNLLNLLSSRFQTFFLNNFYFSCLGFSNKKNYLFLIFAPYLKFNSKSLNFKPVDFSSKSLKLQILKKSL